MINVISTIHNHCALCDGKATAEEMAAEAFLRGFTDFGFSSHSVAPFDLEYSLKEEQSYLDKIAEIKEDYLGKMRVYCGIEQDYYAPVKNRSDYDFLIGAAHYLKVFDGYFPIDANPKLLEEGIKKYFDGDPYAFAKAYFELAVKNVTEVNPDVVAHFDLITKYESHLNLFAADDKKYQNIALDALEKIDVSKNIFEVNTGGMCRADKKTPYPAPFILKRLAEKKARVLLSADAHETKNLTYNFEQTLVLLKKCGFKYITMFINGHFDDFLIGNTKLLNQY